MRLDDFLQHFVNAAAAADRRYVRTQDPRDVLAGITVWESLVDGGGLEELPASMLIEANLAASMLYTRRHEVHRSEEDLDRALRWLDEARAYIVPGSFADLQARMSLAAMLMMRFRARHGAHDLDRAISVWTGLMDTEAGPLAAANLGRALLARHATTGDIADRREGRRLLGMATAEMPADHPARADVELALRAAG
ncbi:hypothetical protein OM076_18045 [Solirubrobacter ginsenosidimutans]|uniref:Tetratricopeptide repeat protein n=2 Tax=Solirubrobacter ginsenosidimutans TaxID=490573 RepID=A0A9X3S1C3_9ACTN|nr:hypothetical protein [Solirubrobacter ginsenosidimutans]